MNETGDEEQPKVREHSSGEAPHENETIQHQGIPHLRGEEDSVDIHTDSLKGET
mgnify:CR=1 FL=1